jgi:hypothetical protein
MKLALAKMRGLQIIISVEAAAGGQRAFQVNASFRQCLRAALLEGTIDAGFTATSASALASASASGASTSASTVSVEELDAHARVSWDGVLQHIVGQAARGSDFVRRLLHSCGLITGQGGATTCTKAGWHFLFKSFPVQLWTLMQALIKPSDTALTAASSSSSSSSSSSAAAAASSSGPDLPLLRLLFRLSFLNTNETCVSTAVVVVCVVVMMVAAVVILFRVARYHNCACIW